MTGKTSQSTISNSVVEEKRLEQKKLRKEASRMIAARRDKCYNQLRHVFGSDSGWNNTIFCKEVWDDTNNQDNQSESDSEGEDDDNENSDAEEDDDDDHFTPAKKKWKSYLPPRNSTLHNYLLKTKDEIKDQVHHRARKSFRVWYPPPMDSMQDSSTDPESWYIGNTWVYA